MSHLTNSLLVTVDSFKLYFNYFFSWIIFGCREYFWPFQSIWKQFQRMYKESFPFA